MKRLKAGDDSALNELIDRWQIVILSYLERSTGSAETAKDLTQEVFVRLFNSRKRYSSSGLFSSYLFSIATNLARNHYRWKKRHPEEHIVDPEALLENEQSRHVSAAEIITQRERADRVRKAVLSLPEKLRVCVILFHFQELQQSEIAEILNCTEKAVEIRLYRARQKLKEALSMNDVESVHPPKR